MSESSTTRIAFPALSAPSAASLFDLAEAAGRGQFLDRADHVLDVDDQDRRAILHQRGGADVLDLAEPRVERLDDQFALAEEAVDHQAVDCSLVADHDDRQVAVEEIRRAALKDLVRAGEPDLPPLEGEMLAPFEEPRPAPRRA